MSCPHHGERPILFAWYIDTHNNKLVRDTIIKLLIALFGYKIEIEIVVEKIK